MIHQNLLRIYEDELHFLREQGKAFGEAYPSVASKLSSEPQDALTERLVQSFAFLTARVQERIQLQQPEIALNLLSDLAPGWYAPRPARITVAIIPDFSAPSWKQAVIVPKGTALSICQGDNVAPQRMWTERDIELAPVELSSASLALEHDDIPVSKLDILKQHKACLKLRFTTKGVVFLNEVSMDVLSIAVVDSSISSFRLFELISRHLEAVYFYSHGRNQVWEKHDSKIFREEISRPDIGGLFELPGQERIRRILENPSATNIFEISGLSKFFCQTNESEEFDIIFGLGDVPSEILGRVSAESFQPFAIPVVNLQKRRCDPTLYNSLDVWQTITVDRTQPSRFVPINLHKVRVSQGDDKILDAVRTFEPEHFDEQEKKLRLTSRYKTSAQLTTPALEVAISQICHEKETVWYKSILIDADVVDWSFHLNEIDSQTMNLESAKPARKARRTSNISKNVDLPSQTLIWDVLKVTRLQLLKVGSKEENKTTDFIKWIRTFVDGKNSAQVLRLRSIISFYVRNDFVNRRLKGSPLAVLPCSFCKIELSSSGHGDGAAFHFGLALVSAINDFRVTNQALEIDVYIDDQIAISRSYPDE